MLCWDYWISDCRCNTAVRGGQLLDEGQPLQSPYAFGDADFRSFDSSCPHLMSVLLDTFHGLFPSHPYVVIGVGCLGALAGKAYASGSYAIAVAWGLYVVCSCFASLFPRLLVLLVVG